MYSKHSKTFPNILRTITFIAHVAQFYFCYTKICSESPGEKASFVPLLVPSGIFAIGSLLALIDTIFFIDKDTDVSRFHIVDMLMAWILLIYLIPYVVLVISIKNTHEDSLGLFWFIVGYPVFIFEVGFPSAAHFLWRRWTELSDDYDEDEDEVPPIACVFCYPCFVIDCALPAGLFLIGNPFPFFFYLIQAGWNKRKYAKEIARQRKEKEEVIRQYA